MVRFADFPTDSTADMMRFETSLGLEIMAARLEATLRISAPIFRHEFLRLGRNHLLFGRNHVPGC